MNFQRKLNLETSYSIIYKLLTIFVSFLLVPILVNLLGKGHYGLWVTISSILSWVVIFDFGLGLGLRNNLVKTISNKDYANSKSLITSAFVAVSIIFISIMLILLIFNQYLSWNSKNFLNLTMSSLEKYYDYSLLVLSLIFIFQLINNLYYAIHDSSNVELIRLCRQGVILISVLLIVKSSNNFKVFYSLSTIFCFLPLLVLLIFTIIFFRKNNKYLIPSFSDFKFSSAKLILNLGIKFFIIRLSSVFIISILPFLLTRYIGVETTAEYNIGFKLFNLVYAILIILSTPYWSAVTEKFNLKQFGWIKSKLKLNMVFSTLCIACIIILVILSPYIIEIWMGSNNFIKTNTIYWCAIFISSLIITEPVLLFLNGTSKISVQTYCSLAIIILIIPFSLFLFNNTDLEIGAFILPPVIFRILRCIIALIELKNLLR